MPFVTADMRDFLRVWLGQVVSLTGTGLTFFALSVWVYRTTGSVTEFGIMVALTAIPGLALSPFIGAIIDRFDRRRVMIWADVGAALTSLVLLVLFFTGRVELWHVYVLVAIGWTFETVQIPAFIASSSLMVPKQHFGRLGGLMQFGMSGAQILAPILGGLLLVTLKVYGVIAIDLATFLFAILMLALVRIPRPPRMEEPADGKPSMLRDVAQGWRAITGRPGLVLLLLFFAALNLFFGLAFVLVTPMVLSTHSPAALGTVLGVASAGALVGSLVMSAWGGPKKKMHGILGFTALLGLCLAIAGARPLLLLTTLGLFGMFFVVPFVNACNQAIWQVKIAPGVQGRVHAMRQMIGQSSAPVAYLLAGPLVDRVVGPMMAPGGALADSIGRVLGVGSGRGIGLVFVAMGALLVLSSAAGYLHPRLRNLEDELPDAVGAEPVAAVEPPEPAGPGVQAAEA